MATVRDILKALDVITGGRVITDSFGYGGANPFVVTKTSGIPGKAVTELPGLVWGDPDMPVKKVAVMMTLTESAIELAGATGIDCLIAHHPIAEGSNTGGVTARDYFNLYHLAVFELHEAFHGLHPGIAWIHGSCAKHVNIRFGGVPGKIVWYGNALPEVETLGDLLNRIDTIMGTDIESRVLTPLNVRSAAVPRSTKPRSQPAPKSLSAAPTTSWAKPSLFSRIPVSRPRTWKKPTPNTPKPTP